ncbi:hypothetical protein RCL1_005302 [Eukaryota sp. TZLM3-RCL]
MNDGRSLSLTCSTYNTLLSHLFDEIRFQFDIPESYRLRLIYSGFIIQNSPHDTLSKVVPPLAPTSVIHCSSTAVEPIDTLQQPSETEEETTRGFARLIQAGMPADEVLMTRLQFYIFRQRSLVPNAVPNSIEEMLVLENSWIDNNANTNIDLSSSLSFSSNLTANPTPSFSSSTSDSSRISRLVAADLRDIESIERDVVEGDAIDFIVGFIIGFIFIFSFAFLLLEDKHPKEMRYGVLLGLVGFIMFSLLRVWSFSGY